VAPRIVIYRLSKRYQVHIFALGNTRRTFKYGLLTGFVLLAVHAFNYARLGSDVSAEYTVFIHYSLTEKLLDVLDAVALTPIVEEMLFRGFIY
jgi:membrane protease YdiL (CAAX protease family)